MKHSARIIAPRSGEEPRYRLLFEMNPKPAWIIDRETGAFLLVNDAALRVYGYTREEFLAMSIADIRLPAENGELNKYVLAQSTAPFLVSGTWHHRRKNGSMLVVQLNVEQVVFSGRPALLTFVLDPERDGAYAALKARESQLAAAQALAHVGSWEWDIAANHAAWSDEFYRICGLPLGTPAGYQEFMAALHPEDRTRVAGIIDGGLASATPCFDYECRLIRPDGEIRHLLNRHSLTLDAGGKPVRMTGIGLDITDRRRMEQTLAESERQHRAMVENASDLVTVVGPDGVFRYMSPSVGRLLGYGVEELIGRNALDLVHPEDLPAVQESMRLDLASPGTPHPVEFRVPHRDGSWRTLEAIGQAFEEAPGSYRIIVNSRDITERKAAEVRQKAMMEELHATQALAEAATRAKSEFLANMSHEIRTPLNAVLGLTEIVLESELLPEQRRHLEMVAEAGDVLLTLLNDILDLSKIEAEHLGLETIPLDLPALIHASASLFGTTARERGLELLVDVGAEVPRWVQGDPTRIRQILSNLLSNAIKFTHEGEIVIAAVSEAVADAAVRLRLSVRDTGIGIPADRLASIFQEFGQLDASTTRRYGGTGLGLTIARRLAALMHGTISVTSEPGRGSEFTFEVELPLAASGTVRVGAMPVRLAGTRVLVVDDNATNRRIIREILTSAGAAVDEAGGATEALAALDAGAGDGRPFALALLDSQMADRDGWSLGHDIRGDPRMATCRLVILTSGSQRGDAERCRAMGIDGYLVKPVSRSELIEALGSVLAGNGTGGKVVTRHALTEARAHLRILLAEDNLVNQEVAAAMLRKRGHLVSIVDNGAKAVRAVTLGTFDVVLMDVHMPEMDGLRATAAIRQLPGKSELPIIALTADALTGEWQRCLTAGMSGYLSKPFKSHDLFAMVEGWGLPPSPVPAPDEESGARSSPADVDGFRSSMREAGAEDAVEEILDTFVADAAGRRAALTKAVASGRPEEMQAAAHAFKSAAGAIGARSLAALLLQMELAGKERRVEDARALLPGIEQECESVTVYLRGLRAGAPSHA